MQWGFAHKTGLRMWQDTKLAKAHTITEHGDLGTHLSGSLSVHSNIWQLLVPNHRRASPVTFKWCAWLSQ